MFQNLRSCCNSRGGVKGEGLVPSITTYMYIVNSVCEEVLSLIQDSQSLFLIYESRFYIRLAWYNYTRISRGLGFVQDV